MYTRIYGTDKTQCLLKKSQYNSSRLRDAVSYANKQHAGQFRKSAAREPMISHCLNVGDTLAKVKMPENVVIAGILHDTIEDTRTTKSDLAQRYGSKVASLVGDVTETTNVDNWMQRCQMYIDHLKKSPKEALCISAADKIDNMNSISNNILHNFNIFKNMEGTPSMQMTKFKGVYNVIKGKLPVKLEEMYVQSLKRLEATLKHGGYLR